MTDTKTANALALVRRALQAFATGGTASQPSGPVDWAAFLAIARQQRLAPILVNALPNGLPQAVRQPLEADARQRRLRAVVMTEAFAAIQRRFDEEGLAVIPLKGLALAHSVYPSLSTRYFDDLDLLIMPGQAEAALGALRSLDYVSHPNASAPEWHHLAPYVHPRYGTVVELHLDLFRRIGTGWALEGVWQRAKPGRLGGIATRVLDPVDALIHALLHGRHDLFRRITALLDVHFLLLHLGEPARDALIAALKEARVQNVFRHVMMLLEKELELTPGIAIPAGRSWRVRLTRHVAGWEGLTPRAGDLADGPLGRVSEMALMDSVADSARLGWRLLFPPPAFVLASYGRGAIRSRQLPGHYFRRLRNRAAAVARQVGRR